MRRSSAYQSILRYTSSFIFLVLTTGEFDIRRQFFNTALLTASISAQTTAVEQIALNSNNSWLTVSTHDLTVLVQENITFEVILSGPLDKDISIRFVRQHEALVELYPHEFTISSSNPQNQTVNILGVRPGHLEITAGSVPNDSWIVNDLFVRVIVANSEIINYISLAFGWFYFLAWSISFYPQIYINFKRKSVVGLNLDFLAFNVVGFALYAVFNFGLYWIPEVQAEYNSRHPRSVNPVLLNDVVFAPNALLATILTVMQCFIYERGNQRVSTLASGILGLFFIFVLVTMILSVLNILHWLDFLYYCSYIKLIITMVKYIPQALINYRRKSTAGWSIGTVLMDFAGGAFSMLQMILNAYNYDDWISIFGDPTKFGLGLLSVIFDMLFILQHYVFYRTESNPPEKSSNGLYNGATGEYSSLVKHPKCNCESLSLK
ncbi:PREDICTED: cystinosin homolog [Rhagoletis zephyria]|uniref:cystinosin homolog n=1 Tax=Rhagoletis zephyria TaxID=28612 RepID=UPI0008119103|nr:PREDICTED: cystinosin homolog [Rhagoletis zephyria]